MLERIRMHGILTVNICLKYAGCGDNSWALSAVSEDWTLKTCLWKDVFLYPESCRSWERVGGCRAGAEFLIRRLPQYARVSVWKNRVEIGDRWKEEWAKWRGGVCFGGKIPPFEGEDQSQWRDSRGGIRRESRTPEEWQREQKKRAGHI